MSLTPEERATYEWQMWVEDFGEAGQEKLKAASVLVSRVGGLGSVVAYELAAAGVGRLILAHNEDGDDRNEGRMFVAKVTPPSGVRFISFVYPGLLPGNGPGFNDRGICQTTNYIEPKEVARGVPRYFVGRSVLEAKSLDEAVSLATCRERCGRAVSVLAFLFMRWVVHAWKTTR